MNASEDRRTPEAPNSGGDSDLLPHTPNSTTESVDDWALLHEECALLRQAKLVKSAASRVSITDLNAEIGRLPDDDRPRLVRLLKMRVNAPTTAIAQALRTTVGKAPHNVAVEAMHDGLHYGVLATARVSELEPAELAALLGADRTALGFLLGARIRESLSEVTEFGVSEETRAAAWSSMIATGHQGSVAALAWLVADRPTWWTDAQNDAVNAVWEVVTQRLPMLPDVPLPLTQLCARVAEMESSGELEALGAVWLAEQEAADGPPDRSDAVSGLSDSEAAGAVDDPDTIHVNDVEPGESDTADLDGLSTRLMNLRERYDAVRDDAMGALNAAFAAGVTPSVDDAGQVVRLALAMSQALNAVATATGEETLRTIAAAVERIDDMRAAAAAAESLGEIERLTTLTGPEFVADELKQVAVLAGEVDTNTDAMVVSALHAIVEAVTIGASNPQRTTELLRTVQSTLPAVASLVMMAGAGAVHFADLVEAPDPALSPAIASTPSSGAEGSAGEEPDVGLDTDLYAAPDAEATSVGPGADASGKRPASSGEPEHDASPGLITALDGVAPRESTDLTEPAATPTAVAPAATPTAAIAAAIPARTEPEQASTAATEQTATTAPEQTLDDALADLDFVFPESQPDLVATEAPAAAPRPTGSGAGVSLRKPQGQHRADDPDEAGPVAQDSDAPGPWASNGIDDIDATALLIDLLDGRQYALAAALADVATDGSGSAIGTAHRLAAHAMAIHSSAGPNASAFADCVRELEPDSLHGKPGTQLLVYAASVRAGLLSPTAGAAGPLRDVCVDIARSTPVVTELTDAILTAIFSGAHLTPRNADTVGELAELDADYNDLVDAAKTHLQTGSLRTIRYQAATELWKLWLSPGEYLGQPLGIVASGSRSDADVRTVRERVKEILSRNELEQAIDRDASRASPATRRPRRIEARARDKIIEWCTDIGDTLRLWVEATENLSQAGSGGWMASQIHDLRERVSALRTEALTQLAEQAGDPGTPRAAEVGAALEMLETTLDFLTGTATVDSAPEMTPDRVINGPLALAPDLPMTADPTVAPRRRATVADVAAAAAALAAGAAGWTASFNARSDRGDQIGTQILVDTLRTTDSALARRLSTERDQAVVASTENLDAAVASLTSVIDADRRFGRLTSDGWTGLSSQARTFDPATRGARTDFDVMLAALADIEADRDKQVTEVVQAAWHDLGTVTLTNEQRATISASIERQDVTTAYEYLELVRSGEQLPALGDEVDHLRRFFPTFPVLFSSPDRSTNPLLELKAAIDAGANPESGRLADALRAAGIDVEQIRRSQAAAARIDGWTTLAKGRSFDARVGQLKPVLEQIGFLAQTVTVSTQQQSGPGRMAWLQLTGVRPTSGYALIPAFGTAMSPSGDTLRVLGVWGSRTPQEIVTVLGRQEREHSVIVLYFGTLSPKARSELATLMRTTRAVPTSVVIDDAAFAYLVAQPEAGRDTTMAVTLPFASASPYTPDVAGLVPVEMFYGRTEELDQVMSMMGSCLVYGGRQLGKSALLRAAARDFDSGSPDRVAIYQSIYRVGGSIPVTAVWTTVWPRLEERGIVTGDMPADNVGSAVVDHIVRWIEANPDRRLLLLLDESDSFLDVDSKDGKFSHVTELKELMERTGRAVKVVFAGLHQTARFERLANHPLAHLGNPVCVGPLGAQQAYKLLTRPLRALGYRFVEDNDAARVLALANNQPALIQLFGAKLLARLQRTASPSVPKLVTRDDIEAVWADDQLRSEFRKRFEWTLNLDPRYRVIAYSVAFQAHANGVGTALSPTDLRSQCEQWWPQGFGARDVRTGEFRALLDECVSLGVLSYDAGKGGYRLRTPNVLSLLGTREEVDEVLDSAEQLDLPESFDASLLRPAFGSGSQRSPLTSAQIADLLAPRSQVRIITGSDALTLDWCANALREQNDSAVHGRRAVPVRDASAKMFEGVCAQAASMAAPTDHTVVIVDLRTVLVPLARKVWTQAREIITGYSRGTLGVVLLTGPRQAALWPIAAAESDASAGLTELHRYDNTGLRLWLTDTALPYQDDASRADLLLATGGWPSLVSRTINEHAALQAEQDGGDPASGAPRDALGRVRAWLADPAHAAAFLNECGLRANPVLTQAWDFLLANLTDDASDAQTLAELMALTADSGEAAALTAEALAEAEYEDTAAVVEVLRTLGVLVASEHDGQLRLEPTVAAVSAIEVSLA